MKLFSLKPLAGELQCPAVFGDGADDVVGRAGGNLGFDLQGDGDLGSYEARQMRDDL